MVESGVTITEQAMPTETWSPYGSTATPWQTTEYGTIYNVTPSATRNGDMRLSEKGGPTDYFEAATWDEDHPEVYQQTERGFIERSARMAGRHAENLTRGHPIPSLAALLVAAVIFVAAAGSWSLYRRPTGQIPPVAIAPEDRFQKAKLKLTLPLVPDIERKPTPSLQIQDEKRLALPIRLPLDSQSLQQYEDEFTAAALKVEKTWESTPETARTAFVKHFLPTVDGAAPPAPLAFFQRHAEALRAIQRPAETDRPAERNLYAIRLRLVTSIFNAASSRLLSLTQLESFCRAAGIGSPVLGLETPKLPSADELNMQKDDLITFPEFLAFLGAKLGAHSYAYEVDGKGIPRVLARRLAGVLRGAGLQIGHDGRQTEAFRWFLEAVGMELAPHGKTNADCWTLPMSPGSRPFHADAFRFVLAEFEEWRIDQLRSSEFAMSWAREWTVNGVLHLLERLEVRESNRLKDKNRLKDEAKVLVEALGQLPPRVHDLYELAVALL